MRFARLGEPGAEQPFVVSADGRHYDLAPVTAEIDGAFLASGGIERARAAYDAGELAEREDAASLRIGSPIARPGAVYCIGMNYAAHAAESGSEPPREIVLFQKAPNTVVGPDDSVQIPPGSVKTDWEVELGLVIGTTASRLGSPADSAAHIAGCVVADDLSEREWQLERSGGQWGKGKSAPGFCPTGPWLVTPDDIDPHALRLRSWVNGEPRQDSSTADLIFDVDTIVYELSQFLTLDPGDLILTGTPQGVALSGRFPYLRAGDVVDLEIEGLGHQRHAFTAAEGGAR